MNRTRREGSGNENRDNTGLWTAGAVATGVAALAGGIYWMYGATNQEATPSRSQDPAEQPSTRGTSRLTLTSTARTSTNDLPESSGWASYLTNLLNYTNNPSSKDTTQTAQIIPNAPRNPVVTNLNSLLSDIYVRYIQLKPDDFRLHYRVFDSIFQDLHKKMKEVDLYYGRYSSTVQFAGSHFDNLRIKKPDEFDMDIIIALPLNLRENLQNPRNSDIVLEPRSAGYLQLRMGEQFQKLPMRDGHDWQINKVAYEWMDGNKFLLRSKFLDWFKGVVDKALNRYRTSTLSTPCYCVDGVRYYVRKSESGPAVTLIIENESRSFRMDVDLVPALKLPEERWPIGPSYRRIPENCKKGFWMVVGKPMKAALNEHEKNRSWRIALHNQERDFMHNSYHLRQTVRLIKKLRDTLGMKEIASYYIKTIFFWEIIERKDGFWSSNNPTSLFKIMVKRLHEVLVAGRIPYFWNKDNNLIGNVSRSTLHQYAAKLGPLINILNSEGSNNQDYKQVARFLLTPEEHNEYKIYLS